MLTIRNKKRTDADFSNHELHVIRNEHVLIHRFKQPNTNCGSLIFINSCGVCSVTGDYGNWIFNREFHPGASEYGVSDDYWGEKLRIASVQDDKQFDDQATLKALKETLHNYKQENEFEINNEIVEYYEECIEKCEGDEIGYTHFVYSELPSCLDYDDVILVKDYKHQLKIVFDAFDAMCEFYNRTPELITYA